MYIRINEFNSRLISCRYIYFNFLKSNESEESKQLYTYTNMSIYDIKMSYKNNGHDDIDFVCLLYTLILVII